MKCIYSILIVIILPFTITAQTHKYASERLHFFVAPMLEIGEVAGETGLSAGLVGGLRYENWWVGLYDLKQYQFDYQNALKESCRGKWENWGFWTGREQKVNEMVAVYAGTRVAWGLIELKRPNSRFSDADYYGHILVITPEAGMIWQIFPRVQIAWTAGYRWINGVEKLPGLENKDFHSFVNTLSLRVGVSK